MLFSRPPAPTLNPPITHSLIFAHGELYLTPEGQAGQALAHTLAEAHAHHALIIAADGGAEHALPLLGRVDVLIGDMDSVSPATLRHIEGQGGQILRYPQEKNETDLELALLEATERGAHWIRILAALGGRLDQTLGNMYLLALPALAKRDVRLVSDRQTAWVIGAGDHALMGALGDTISLLPFGGPVSGITTEGLQYPLKNERLYFGPARGMSNVISSENPRITIQRGQVLVVHTIGRA